jgi:maleylpyruvate isomerase
MGSPEPGTAAGPARRSVVPVSDLEQVDEATGRFLGAVGGVSGADISRPTLLPGWTVGHVLTHVARNADSHIRRAEAAMHGEVIDQYPGGLEGRAAEIEAGAACSAGAILDDVAASCDVLAAVWDRVPEDAWQRVTRDVGGRERPLFALPGRRWQELEVHLVDLGIGVTHRDWPDEFVTAWLPRLEVGVSDRSPPGHPPPDTSGLDDRDRLAWLYGRLLPPGLPELAPWS